MRQVSYKSKYLRMAFFCIVVVLALANIPVPKVSAVDNYFTVEGSTLRLDELGPDDDRAVTVTVKAAREMDLRNILGHFTPVGENDEELEMDPNWGIKSYSMGIYCSWAVDGYFEWNTEACYSQYHGFSDDIHYQAGDTIFEATYMIKPDVLLTKRSLPVTINAAVVNDEGEVAINDVTLNAEVSVYPAEDYHTISISEDGHGSVVAPVAALPNEVIEINVVPDENNELLYIEINGQDMTSQVENNKIIISVTQDLYILAHFHSVYKVTEGDGSEYVRGSGNDLSFKIDTDLSDFENNGLIMVDGNFFDMSGVVVDTENNTLTLPASYLAMLDIGKHKLEVFFPLSERWVARASFTIVEQRASGEESEKEDSLIVPNTGVFTNKNNDAKPLNNSIAPIVITGILLGVGFLLMKHIKKQKDER